MAEHADDLDAGMARPLVRKIRVWDAPKFQPDDDIAHAAIRDYVQIRGGAGTSSDFKKLMYQLEYKDQRKRKSRHAYIARKKSKRNAMIVGDAVSSFVSQKTTN